VAAEVGLEAFAVGGVQVGRRHHRDVGVPGHGRQHGRAAHAQPQHTEP